MASGLVSLFREDGNTSITIGFLTSYESIRFVNGFEGTGAPIRAMGQERGWIRDDPLHLDQKHQLWYN